MRVLVTGGTGFVGSHTVAALCAGGHHVKLLVRDPARMAPALAPHGLADLDYEVGDVTDAAAVERALEGCDSVVHAAAVVAMEAHRAEEVTRTNVRGVERVLGAAHARGLRSIVYVSSASALFTPGAGEICVDSPIAGGPGAYARSKARALQHVRELEAAGAPLRTCYPPALVGPDDPGLSGGNHTVATFLRQTMVRTAGGFEVMDVRDLARLHVALVDPEVASGRYLVGGAMLAWDAVIALMDELTGRRVRRVAIPAPLLRRLGGLGDFAKRLRDFEFPLTREGMEMATQWPGVRSSPELLALKFRLRPARESYADAIRWLYRAGHIDRQQAGRLAEGDGGQA